MSQFFQTTFAVLLFIFGQQWQFSIPTSDMARVTCHSRKVSDSFKVSSLHISRRTPFHLLPLCEPEAGLSSPSRPGRRQRGRHPCGWVAAPHAPWAPRTTRLNRLSFKGSSGGWSRSRALPVPGLFRWDYPIRHPAPGLGRPPAPTPRQAALGQCCRMAVAPDVMGGWRWDCSPGAPRSRGSSCHHVELGPCLCGGWGRAGLPAPQ